MPLLLFAFELNLTAEPSQGIVLSCLIINQKKLACLREDKLIVLING